jgi:hypothetical protein
MPSTPSTPSINSINSFKYGYTLEVYRFDKRSKAGERLVKKVDYDGYSGNAMMDVLKDLHAHEYPRSKYRLDFFPTWVTKRNFMTGEEFQERYDTPYYCSPSSETYWSS